MLPSGGSFTANLSAHRRRRRTPDGLPGI